MTWRTFLTLACATPLLSMCAAATDPCAGFDLIQPSAPGTVEWLVENDRRMAEDVLAHNRTYEAICF